jgi:hypothetical protein
MRRAALLIFAAFAIAGCGGSTSAFVDRADFVCAQAQKDSRALVTDEHRLIRSRIGDVVRIVQRMTAELSRITPPKALKARYERYLAASKEEANLARRLAVDIRSNDHAAAVTTADKLESHAGREAAARLGLDVCAVASA